MSPEQRAAAAQPVGSERIGKAAQAQLAAWGWPGYAGFGGYGAFAFPAMYGYGTGLGWGGLGYGSAYGTGLGGLGYGGWYW